MNNELKRVGLVFKEDGAADFRKSLQLVNAELSKNYSEFKKTQAQWDNSTKKTEKLKSEIDSLSNAYDLQQDKITILRAQLSELESAENQNVTAITKKRAELEKAELKLISYDKKIKELSNQLKISGKDITNFGENIQKVGNKIENIGNKISMFSVTTGSALALSAKSAIDFEDAFAGVEKTVSGTEEQMAELEQGIKKLAKEIPSTTTEISAVAEAAGQLGIKTEDILSFSKVMIDLGNSTNLSSEEAASALAKFANVTKMSAKDYDKLGSTIVALGNNFATTERDIVEMATRLSSTGELTGLTESQILALATAISSVGIEAEAGGTAMSKLLKRIQLATETGADDLKELAKIANMSSKEFKQAFEKDAVKALSAFISGLNDTERNGKSAIAILEDMDIKEARMSNTILSLTNASDLMNNAIELSNEAWEDNTALTNEANKRYDTLKSKLQISLNKLSDMAITLGNKLMPSVEKILEKFSEWVKKFENLSDEQIDFIIKIGLLITALGPLVTTIGKVTSGVGTAVKGIGTFKTALEVMKGTTTSSSVAVNGLASVFSAITSPVGIACIAITAAVAGIALAVNESQKEVKKDFESMGNSANDFINGINNATSYLSNFNTELFVSSQEQQELQNQMNEIQSGITSICKTASEERRNYTSEEILRLDEYFTKLRELNEREIQVQQEISTAITQQAITNAESFQGSLEEYKIQSQEWIKTAQDQKTKTIELVNQQTIEEVALLNQRYGDQATMQNAAYATEYNQIMLQKQSKIDAANDEIARISEAYTNGYTNRLLQDAEFKAKIDEYNKNLEAENKRHSEEMNKINSESWRGEYFQRELRFSETEKYDENIRKLYKKLTKGMSDEQASQLGVLMGMASNTEVYGGNIEDETKDVVNSIIDSYDSMPKKTRTAMKNAMSPMLDEMEKAEPDLFAKAFSIGGGIVSRLMKAFDEHSPSRKTRKIAKFAMQPMEEEMEKGKKNLFEEADEIGNGITDRLGEIQTSYGYDINKNVNNMGQSNYGEINYEKLSNAFLIALNKCKLKIEEDGFVKLIQDEMYKVI